MRAKSFALSVANQLDRQGQQELLFDNVLQQQPFALVVANLGFRLADRSFISPRIHSLRAVQQVKSFAHILDHGIKAASTPDLHLGGKLSHQQDILNYLLCAPVFLDQLRMPFSLEGRLLADIRSKVNHSGQEIFVEYNSPELKFLYFYKHRGPLRNPE